MPGTIPAGSAARAARQATACDYSLVQCDIFKLPSPSPFPGGRGDLGPCKSDDLRQVLIPEVTAIYRWLAELPAARPAAARLWEHCRNALRAATAEPIQAPKDWAREADLGCKCADCRALAAFLRDPAARVGRFPLRKDRRQHLHGIIDGRQCDCTHVTERKGSPQTLVCTKTQASYERRLEQFQSDRKSLEELETLSTAKSSPAAKSSRASSRGKKKPKGKNG